MKRLCWFLVIFSFGQSNTPMYASKCFDIKHIIRQSCFSYHIRNTTQYRSVGGSQSYYFIQLVVEMCCISPGVICMCCRKTTDLRPIWSHLLSYIFLLVVTHVYNIRSGLELGHEKGHHIGKSKLNQRIVKVGNSQRNVGIKRGFEMSSYIAGFEVGQQ